MTNRHWGIAKISCPKCNTDQVDIFTSYTKSGEYADKLVNQDIISCTKCDTLGQVKIEKSQAFFDVFNRKKIALEEYKGYKGFYFFNDQTKTYTSIIRLDGRVYVFESKHEKSMQYYFKEYVDGYLDMKKWLSLIMSDKD